MAFENLLYQQDLLNQVYSQGIQQNEEHIKIWTRYRNWHKEIIEGLQILSNELSENCIVRLGKRALMRGKLMHTNEILVSIGDGYFVKYSTQQAVALCNRRIKYSEEMLKKLEQERNLLEVRQMLPMNCGAFELGESKDIMEHWDDEKLKNWRAEHRKREQEYHQKLKELRNQEKIEIKTEEDLFKRLDQLELEEELADELNRLEEEHHNFYDSHSQEADENEYDEDDQLSEETEETVEKETTEINKVEDEGNTNFEKKNKGLQNSEQEQSISKEEYNICETAQRSNEKTNTSVLKDTKINGKFEVSIIKEDEVEKVLKESSFLSDSCTTIHRFTEDRKHKKYKQNHLFDHSTFLQSDAPNEKTKSSGRRVSFAEPHYIEMESSSDHDNDSEPDETTDKKSNKKILKEENVNDDVIKIDFKHSETQSPIIEGNDKDIISPRDIYRIFCKPKSILKRPCNNQYNSKNTSPNEYHLQDNSENEAKSFYSEVVQDVQERKIGQPTESNEPVNKKRPISRFKLERTNLKK